jgi:hypothetical protein
MKKLRNLLAAALLTIPVATLNASPLSVVADGTEMRSTLPVAGCCVVYYMGRWVCMPC